MCETRASNHDETCAPSVGAFGRGNVIEDRGGMLSEAVGSSSANASNQDEMVALMKTGRKLLFEQEQRGENGHR